jgi:hypothetical protein
MITHTQQPLSLLELALSRDNTVSVLDDNGNNVMTHDTDNSLDTGLGNTLSQD